MLKKIKRETRDNQKTEEEVTEMDKIFLRFLAVVGVLVMTSTVFAMELLTKEQALK